MLSKTNSGWFLVWIFKSNPPLELIPDEEDSLMVTVWEDVVVVVVTIYGCDDSFNSIFVLYPDTVIGSNLSKVMVSNWKSKLGA